MALLKGFKERLVSKGYNQKWGIDLEEPFSTVVKMTTVRKTNDSIIIVAIYVDNIILTSNDAQGLTLTQRKFTQELLKEANITDFKTKATPLPLNLKLSADKGELYTDPSSYSSYEAEYRSISSATSEITWLVRLLEELGVTNLKPVTVHCNNQSAIHIAKNPDHHERTKYIEIDVHFTRDKVLEGLVQLSYVPTASQLAEFFPKVLYSGYFQELLSKLEMF
ncbi:uncharacterized protein LOC141717895 [Apium graveolens]|uniref:uncharacterized protein LOC141704219 n=1 Tax=Apium graveolens TaxID=4045 RepID=UPI003D7BE83A